MEKNYYINLANKGLRMPIGADLLLREKPNQEEILHDGEMLGKVIEEAANKYHTPLAVPLMDLMLEKTIMLEILGIPKDDIDIYHFDTCPDEKIINTLKDQAGKYLNKRMTADIQAIEYIANKTNLLPIAMCIGPVSLLTKMVADPITSIYLAGTEDEYDEVKLIETLLEMCTNVILSYLELKIKAGAKAIMVAEPAANKVFFSPKQIESGSDIFERYFLKNNLRLKDLANKYNTDLIFHCCGEITDYMLNTFIKLKPVILSLGSSRKLWEDAALVPKDIVLYGNLPTKKFFSDEEISVDGVVEKSNELLHKMKEVNHPFILGSECDVLLVDGCEHTINKKVDAFMNS
jgi:uroporphyrinogen-III decarboxylase